MRLAAKANLSEATISEFENGFRTPNPRNVAAIRRALEGAGIVFRLEGSPSVARSEAQHRTRDPDNRTWRRRQANRTPRRPVGRQGALTAWPILAQSLWRTRPAINDATPPTMSWPVSPE
ncbi:helix-turn-helix transcriptional regulator [Mesorhizobium sp. WSM3864]|uniref:helix-turn-helix domain-containing protein n=1 Tax=Mesorhizobium sp. WSM3864 TaxID=2029404 RepID=UPI001FE0CBFC|nr:helix-turn-helix transcriptional regulator [Mesorhizobium sp. WSM3864]